MDRVPIALKECILLEGYCRVINHSEKFILSWDYVQIKSGKPTTIIFHFICVVSWSYFCATLRIFYDMTALVVVSLLSESNLFHESERKTTWKLPSIPRASTRRHAFTAWIINFLQSNKKKRRTEKVAKQSFLFMFMSFCCYCLRVFNSQSFYFYSPVFSSIKYKY